MAGGGDDVGGDIAVGERPVVGDAPGLARQSGADGRTSGVVVAAVLCDTPAIQGIPGQYEPQRGPRNPDVVELTSTVPVSAEVR